MTDKLQTREQMLADVTTSEQQAVPVAQLQTIQDWLREPDHAEHFGTSQLVEWINRRPTHIVPAVLASLASHPCQSGEGAGEVRGLRLASGSPTMLTDEFERFEAEQAATANAQHAAVSFSDWPAKTLADQCRMQAREQLDPEFSNFLIEVAIRLALTPDATQTREAELVAALKGFVDDLTEAGRNTHGCLSFSHVRLTARIKTARAALNARGGA